MPTYTVTLYISLAKSYDVEADSEDEAVSKAERLIASSVVGEGFAVDDIEVEGGEVDAEVEGEDDE